MAFILLVDIDVASVSKYEELGAWRKGRLLVNQIYSLTRCHEFSRDFGLRDQIRRAAVSILSNIAEGFERDGDKEFVQFLSLAKGSCGEVRCQLYIALDQQYISPEQHQEASDLTIETSRLLSGLIHYLKKSQFKGRKYRS